MALLLLLLLQLPLLLLLTQAQREQRSLCSGPLRAPPLLATPSALQGTPRAQRLLLLHRTATPATVSAPRPLTVCCAPGCRSRRMWPVRCETACPALLRLPR